MKEFFVLKESNTIADNLEAVGFAKLLKKIISELSNDEEDDVTICDCGGHFKIGSDIDINIEDLGKISYFDFMPYVSKKGEKTDKLTHSHINYDNEQEVRTRFYKLSAEEQKKSEYKPRPDYDIIRLFAGMDGYRKSFENLRKFEKSAFSDLLIFILEYYSDTSLNRDQLLKSFEKILKEKKFPKLTKISALQDINPDKGKGINQSKANSITPKGYNSMLWFKELLKFSGGWTGITSRYFDKDYKNYTLAPSEISSSELEQVFRALKKSIHSNGSVKMDVDLILSLTINLITYHKNFNDSWDFFNPKNSISGFNFAYYKNLGQKPAVTNIGFLGLPNFIEIIDEESGNKWKSILEEHKKRVSNIDEKNSSNIGMLQNYRNFISASNFNALLNFFFDYAVFIISSLNDQKYYIEPFSITNLEELMKKCKSFEDIFSNKGFIAVSKAIRNSTIIPVIHKNKKDVVFGLSNKLKIASRTKESFVSEISEFIQKYNESMMLKDFHQNQHQKYVTTEELAEFFKLLDSDASSKTIAGLLVAFGYAKDPKESNNNSNSNEGN